MAERGGDASLEEIARRSDVGIATLYRHFPTRTDLIRALYEQSLAELVNTASVAFAAPSAWEGVALYVERGAEWFINDPGLPAIIEYMIATDSDYRPAEQLQQSVAALMERAQAAGELRDDVDESDVANLISMFGALSRLDRAAVLDWRRQLGIVLDGLRAENVRTELP